MKWTIQDDHIAKKTVSSFCPHVGTIGSLRQICSPGLQADRPNTANPWPHGAASGSELLSMT